MFVERSRRRRRAAGALAAVAAVLAVVAVGAAVVVDERSDRVGELSGVVVDPAGSPIAGAQVATGDGRRSTTGADGRFVLPGPAAWLTVKADGWLTRSRVGGPGESVVIRLLEDLPGTVTFAFGGDVMFGRRYFDPAEDGSMHGLLSPSSGPARHLALLQGVAPLLGDADLTAVNLESPLAADPYPDPRHPRPPTFHPTKDYVFASAPAAAQALAEAGVDVVDLGNNHLFDRLAPGVDSTLTSLEAAGFRDGEGFFGAGRRDEDAWAPALQEVDGQRIAFVGCTTITGDEHAIIYVARRHKGGAARCSAARLRAAVVEARSRADIVVAMVHGGYEYHRLASQHVLKLTDVAVAAGATLVINHHPHVIGGLRYDQGQLIAWTMGNLLFDQTLSSTFDSYVLQVAVRDGSVVGAWAEPIRLDTFLPTGVYGSDADWVARGAQVRSEGPWVDDDGSLWLDLRGAARRTVAAGEPGLVRIDAGCAPGAGRELLWTGDFETRDLLPGGRPRLWNVVDGDPYRRASEDAAHDGSAGILLHRANSQASDVVLAPAHRIQVHPGDRLTLLVDVRSVRREPTADVQLSWYNDTRGGSQVQTRLPIPVTGEYSRTTATRCPSQQEREWVAARGRLED